MWESAFLEQCGNLAPDFRQIFFRKKSTIEDRGAAVGNAGRLALIERLSRRDGVDVQSTVARPFRFYRHGRGSCGQLWAKLFVDRLQEYVHAVHGGGALDRHAAMRDGS